jgi:NitT/TauT family transport system ATP-binding protein
VSDASHTSGPQTAAPPGPPQASGEAIELRNLGVRYGDLEVMHDLDASVAPGEFVCVIGPSGCGKSTLLNVLAGFVSPSVGEVRIGGRPVRGPDVSRSVVFQSSEALFPWLRVRQNVAFGPRMRRLPRQRRVELVQRYLNLVGLAHCAGRFPHELSGGMRQRVQIARVLANEPRVVLMDEPFGALDAQTREVMQSELDRIWRETRPTIVFITHDLQEAILLADRIFVMTAGPGARFKTVRSVDLPRPRDLDAPAVTQLHAELRETIRAEVAKTLRAEGEAGGQP